MTSILSNLFMSLVADRYGRKYCFLIESFGIFLAFIFLIFFGSHNFLILFLAIFDLQIFTHLFTVAYIYLFEFFVKSLYNWLFLLQNVCFSFLGILIYYVVEKYKSLYYIEITTLIISALVFLFAYIYILESPDWLISKMKHIEDNVNELLEENEKEDTTQEKFNQNMTNINLLVNEFHLLKTQIISVYGELLDWEKTEDIEEKKM